MILVFSGMSGLIALGVVLLIVALLAYIFRKGSITIDIPLNNSLPRVDDYEDNDNMWDKRKAWPGTE